MSATLLRRCRSERIEPPGSSRITRVLGAAHAAYESEFATRRVDRLSAAAVERLAQLVIEPAGEAIGGGTGFLAELKADPGRVGLKTLLAEIEKLEQVRAIGLPGDLFAGASERPVAAWRAQAAKLYPSDLRAAPEPVRLTLLAASCWSRTAEITDGLVDLLIELVHGTGTRAENRVERELSSDLRRVRGKEGILFASLRQRSSTPTTRSARRCSQLSARARCVTWCARPRRTIRRFVSAYGQSFAPRTPRTTGGCCRVCSARSSFAARTPPTGL